MIALTFLLFLFLSFLCFFSLLLSYVFADGELKFNYFVVKVKSCFQDSSYVEITLPWNNSMCYCSLEQTIEVFRHDFVYNCVLVLLQCSLNL